MSPLDALWHLLNLFGAAVGVACIAAAMSKLLWRRELGGAGFLRLAGWGTAAAAVATLAGLLVFGRDGRMATYAGLVLATALALWWAGFGPGRR